VESTCLHAQGPEFKLWCIACLPKKEASRANERSPGLLGVRRELPCKARLLPTTPGSFFGAVTDAVKCYSYMRVTGALPRF
jgi:hypothetical protein